jgi:PAS domain S-box-containing protein
MDEESKHIHQENSSPSTNEFPAHLAKQFFQQTQQLLVVVDEHANILEVNPAAEKFFGYTQAEVCNKQALGLLVPMRNRYGGETQQYLKMFATADKPFSLENENIDAQGNRHWIQWEAIPGERHNGVKQWLCIGKNTSIEQELLTSTTWDYRTFANMLPEIVFELDGQMHLTFLNDYSFYALGYSRQEILGSEDFLRKITSHREYIRLVSYVQTIFMGELHSTKKFTLLTKSGDEMIVEFQYTPVLKDGVVERIRGIAFDITQKERDFLDLAAQEERFRLIYENSPINYLSLDEQGIIVDANPATLLLLKEQREQVIGCRFYDYICRSGRSTYTYLFQKFKSVGEVRNAELQICRNDESHVIVQLSARATYHPNGELKQTYCVLKDITDLKLAEISLKRSEQEMRELNATKDKFFSIIAHDLRNPFNDLIGFTQLLAKNVRRYDVAKIEQFTHIIGESAKLAHNLLENLLDWSRTQTGTLRYNPEEVNLYPLVNECVQLYQSKAEAKGILLQPCLEEDLPVARADKNMIKTVIRNLISNAIKYTRKPDTVTVYAKQQRNQLIIAVEDTGIGIDTAQQKKLFHIDGNVSTPGTAKERGTGLGLILCKEFVEKNGGQISVKSSPGRGSTFAFSLPVHAR